MAALTRVCAVGRRVLSSGLTALALAVLGGSVLFAAPGAHAQERTSNATPDEVRMAQLERLRAEIANQIQLQAFDLVDELVFTWLSDAPFDAPTAVVLADVTGPVGYGSGFDAMVENHVAQVLVKNPKSNVTLVHCPACMARTVHSDATGTRIGRGVDLPKALAQVRGKGRARYALFLDFETEGTALVLRARITQLSDALPIVHARTLTTTMSSAALLREPGHLKSAAEARKEYMDILAGRGIYKLPLRLSLSAFAPGEDAALALPIPIPWLQMGAEMALRDARDWTASLVIGGTWVPEVHTGAMAMVRINRLITGNRYSLTTPNVYLFGGVNLAILQGQTALALAPTQDPPVTDYANQITAYPGFQVGLEVRVNNRIGASVFAESNPSLDGAQNVGNWTPALGFIRMHSIGGEVSFTF